MAKERTCFCTECRKETTYSLRYSTVHKVIRDKEYNFDIVEAICENCGKQMSVNRLMDYNASLIDAQYRSRENLVNVNDISNLMEIYHLGKAPLSLALGFGEITITRYLAGQIPSKEYSDVIKNALENPSYMIEKLKENKSKIGDTAYNKAIKAKRSLDPLFALSDKMLLTISYIFEKAGEVTPLALQKILYFIQGISLTLYNSAFFEEDCEAWAHGPVYKDVYEVFKSFKYNPIDDVRFSMFKNRFHELSDNDKEIINLVINTFGVYSGKVLEQITHNEEPWQTARAGLLEASPSNEIIPKQSIKTYFGKINEQYGLTVDGINKYIANSIGAN